MTTGPSLGREWRAAQRRITSGAVSPRPVVLVPPRGGPWWVPASKAGCLGLFGYPAECRPR